MVEFSFLQCSHIMEADESEDEELKSMERT